MLKTRLPLESNSAIKASSRPSKVELKACLVAKLLEKVLPVTKLLPALSITILKPVSESLPPRKVLNMTGPIVSNYDTKESEKPPPKVEFKACLEG